MRISDWSSDVCSSDLPRALGQRQILLLAAFDIDIPFGQREIAVASRQARSVVDAGPGRLGDAVDALPPPFLQILRIVDFDLANRGDRLLARLWPSLLPSNAVQTFHAEGRCLGFPGAGVV